MILSMMMILTTHIHTHTELCGMTKSFTAGGGGGVGNRNSPRPKATVLPGADHTNMPTHNTCIVHRPWPLVMPAATNSTTEGWRLHWVCDKCLQHWLKLKEARSQVRAYGMFLFVRMWIKKIKKRKGAGFCHSRSSSGGKRLLRAFPHRCENRQRGVHIQRAWQASQTRLTATVRMVKTHKSVSGTTNHLNTKIKAI